MLEINNQYDFFKNVKVTDDGYLQVSVVGGGGGGGTGGTFAFLATNYTDLLTKTGMVTGDIAYVYNSQGAKWLPGTMGGTYYPGGIYIYSASTWTSDRNSISFQLEQDKLSLATKANLSGATFSGPIDSTSTILSGGTDLYDIFSQGDNDITRVQPGTNINTGGTANNPIINLDNNVSLTSLSATTIYSGGTNLSSVFAPIGSSGDITRVQPGTNIFTGGTVNNPTVNITDASLNTLNVSGTTVLAHASATTIALLNNATATTEFSDYNFNTIEANCSLSNIIGGSRNRIIGGSENIQIIGGYSITGSSSATTYVSN